MRIDCIDLARADRPSRGAYMVMTNSKPIMSFSGTNTFGMAGNPNIIPISFI